MKDLQESLDQRLTQMHEIDRVLFDEVALPKIENELTVAKVKTKKLSNKTMFKLLGGP